MVPSSGEVTDGEGGTTQPREMHDVDGVNAGYARLLLDEYLENPEAVAPEWRALFESGDAEVVTSLPGLARLLEKLPRNGGASNGHTAVEDRQSSGCAGRSAVAPPAAAGADAELLGGVAAAMALVKAFRMHGHLAARLDPLGSEPVGDPALDPMRLVPQLTTELQKRVPAVRPPHPRSRREPGRGAAAICRRPTAGRSPTRSSTSRRTSSASGCARRSSRGATGSR